MIITIIHNVIILISYFDKFLWSYLLVFKELNNYKINENNIVPN